MLTDFWDQPVLKYLLWKFPVIGLEDNSILKSGKTLSMKTRLELKIKMRP
jgi:hypothetical protein